MAQIIAQTRTMSGIRRTSSSDTLNCVVEAFHNVSEGEVSRVEFSVSVNGSFVGTITSSSRGDWAPNDTDEQDPLPGNFVGAAPIAMSYGTTISMGNYSPGTIIVTPTAYPVSGTSRTLDSITIINDKDGGDRRSSNKVIYVSPTGDNSKDGLTEGNAIRSIQRALYLLRNGVGTGGADIGGGTIYLLAGEHIWGNGNNAAIPSYDWYCSNNQWVTLTHAPGLKRSDVILRNGEVRFDGARSSIFSTSLGLYARIRIKDLEIKGRSLQFNGSGTYKQVWLEHCHGYPWLGKGELPHVRNTSGGLGGAWVQFDDGEPPSVAPGVSIPGNMKWATGCSLELTAGGWANFRMVRGYRTEKCVGIALNIQRDHNGATNGFNIDHTQWVVDGFMRGITGPFTITKNGNRVRLTSQTTSATWGEKTKALVNQPNCGIILEGGWSASDGSPQRSYFVKDGGYASGFSFVEFDAPNFGNNITSQGIMSASSQGNEYWLENSIATNDANGHTAMTIWHDPHSDLHQLFHGVAVSNWMYTNIRSENSVQTQGFSGGTPSNGFAIVNIFDGYSSLDLPFQDTQNSYVGSSWGTQGIMRHMTIGGQYRHFGNQGSGNHEISDSVFRNWSDEGAITNINVFNNHFIVSATKGTNATIGAFFIKRLDKYDATPTANSTGKGTASTTWTRGSQFYENNRGALRNVAVGNWGLSSSPVSLGQVRSINKTAFSRFGLASCGVPFPKGTVWSRAEKIAVSVPALGSFLTQWYPVGTKYDDGSYKYGRVSYITYIDAGSITDASLTLRGAYSTSFINPGVSNIQRDSTVISLRINNQTQLTDPVTGQTYSSIPLSAASIVEGGSPEDRYTRYRWFGRFTNIPFLWVEIVYDISTTLDHIKFWITYGNSNVIRGYSNSAGPYAGSYGYTLSSPIQLDITGPSGSTSSLIFEQFSTLGSTTIPNGKRYTLVDPGFTAQSGFKAGMCRTLLGSVSYSNSATAQAEAASELLTMYLNWGTLQPPWFCDVLRPAYIETEQEGINISETGHIIDQLRPFYEPYSRGNFTTNPIAGATGGQGWQGAAFWANPLYHLTKSNWPGELIHCRHSLATLCYRTGWWFENDGTYVKRSNYPSLYFWQSSLHGAGASSYDWLGYGQTDYPPGTEINENKLGGGQPWQGFNNQHSQTNSDFLYALISCDYFGLRAAEVWSEIWATYLATDTPNGFINTIDSARATARLIMTALMIYEITGSLTLKKAIKQRIDIVHDTMNHTNISAYGLNESKHDTFFCPSRGIDKLRFTKLEYGNQIGNLIKSIQFNRKHTYPWQEAMVVSAMYQAYLIFQRENPNDPYVAKAKEIAYELASTNVLMLQKFGANYENNWESVSISVPYTLGPGGATIDLSTRQQWNLGTSVVGLSSGATGTIYYQAIATEPPIGGVGVLNIYLKNATVPFITGETIQNTTTGATAQITYIFRGYTGVVAYRVNHTVGSPWTSMTPQLYDQRQAFWTREQLEEYDVNADDAGQALGSSPNILYYSAYLLWQVQCAVVVQEGCLNGYYSDSSTVTVSQLLAKARDIIEYAYLQENNVPQFSSTNPLWPVGFWPQLAIRSNFYQGNGVQTLSYTYNSPKFISANTLNFSSSDITTIVQQNAGIAFEEDQQILRSISTINRIQVSGSNNTVSNYTFNAPLTKLISIDPDSMYSEIITRIVVNLSINASTLSSISTANESSVSAEYNPQGPIIIHVILNMLLDGPEPSTDAQESGTQPLNLTDNGFETIDPDFEGEQSAIQGLP